jgi:ABC-type multidrug transport system fused ATPase/permease subunit
MYAAFRGFGQPPLPRGSSEPISHFKIFLRTLPYAWPEGQWRLRLEFIISIFFAILGSLSDIATPIVTAYLVDGLSGPRPSIPIGAIVAWGLIRFGGTFFQQLRDIFFASVSAHTERRVALDTFKHLQSLSLTFHLKRETGSVLRSISRGASSFGSLLRIVIFSMLPVFFQLIIAAVYLFSRYDFYFALITIFIIVFYFVFTFTTSNWRDRHRRVMITKDNEFNQKAIDALLNFETVKYFNTEQHEEKRYGQALSEYAAANITSQRSLAFLNAGQSAIISFGILLAMFLSAKKVSNGEMSVGDFILIQGLILALYQPLGFLGNSFS